MNYFFNIFIGIIIVQCTTAITREQASPGARVRFHYSEKSKRAQTNQTIAHKANALNGKEAVIMDIPFWRNERRVQIQSVENPDIILAVKPYDLELLDPTMADGETRIDVFISRPQTTTTLKDHVMSERYYQEELPIANNAQYRAVILNNPRIKLQHRTTKSLVRFNRRRTGIHRDHLTLSLLDQIIEWLERCQTMGEVERRINNNKSLRDLVMRCLRVIADSGQRGRGLMCRFNESSYSANVENNFLTFVTSLFREYQLWIVDGFHPRIATLTSGLHRDTMKFYENKIGAVRGLPRLDEVIQMAHGVNRFSGYAGYTESRKAVRLLEEMKNITRQMYYRVEAMEYYLAVGELLVQLRDSGEIAGRIAVNGFQGVCSASWLQAVADFAGCQRRDVSLKIMTSQPMSHELHIDLLIPRINSFSESVYHPDIDGYLRQELQVANNAQYQFVIMNLPESVSQATIKTDRININSRSREMLAILFQQFEAFLDRIHGVRYTNQETKELIRAILWYIWQCTHNPSDEQEKKEKKLMVRNMFHFMSPECRRMIRMHLMELQRQAGHVNLNEYVVLDNSAHNVMVEFCMYLPFALPLYITKGWYPDHLEIIGKLLPKLNTKASQFYEKQLCLQQGLFVSEDSEYAKMLNDLNCTLAKRSVYIERRAIIGKQRDIMSRIHQSVDALQYYLSVGHYLVEMRDSGAALRNIGIICPKQFVNGDWVRALSDIMQCDNRSVTIKMI